jgi:tripartite-type tricarboxylate transporter receptor subunit TctC
MHLLGVRLGAILGAATVLCALLAGLDYSMAQAKYPERPVRIILPFGPGGVADVTMRLVAQQLGERLGHTFIIDNRPGAGGIVATKAALSSAPDGYTFFLGGNGTAISQTLFKSLPYNLRTDFMPVTGMAQFDMLLATRADSPHDSVQKLVAYAKANPGKLNFGTVATGSTQNLSAALFKLVTGVDAALVIFRTTPDLVNGILQGDIDVGFDYYAAFRPTITNKQLRIIATSGEKANPDLPGVPLVKDLYPEYVVTSWNALWAPTGVPPEIIQKINSEVNAILALPEIQKRMAGLGMEPMFGTSEQLGQRMQRDIKKWADVIEKAGIPKQ